MHIPINNKNYHNQVKNNNNLEIDCVKKKIVNKKHTIYPSNKKETINLYAKIVHHPKLKKFSLTKYYRQYKIYLYHLYFLV